METKDFKVYSKIYFTLINHFNCSKFNINNYMKKKIVWYLILIKILSTYRSIKSKVIQKLLTKVIKLKNNIQLNNHKTFTLYIYIYTYSGKLKILKQYKTNTFLFLW